MRHFSDFIAAAIYDFMRVVYFVELFIFRLTGARGRVLRKAWKAKGERLQFLLNLHHGTEIEYGYISE